MTFRPRAELLQDDEILRLVRIFAELGFHKFRLTGGEPTVRANVVDIVRGISQTPGVRTVVMTTNGLLLARRAGSGRRRPATVNISIDTVDPEKFRKLTRWGKVEDVWEGIEAAEAAGLEVKLNAVVVRNYNDREDVVQLAALTQKRNWQVRFIEMMPFGDVADFQQAGIVPEAELRATIAEALGPLELLNGGALDGEARLYRLQDGVGSLGFISTVTEPFCAGCTRVRLTADGRLRLCLLRENEVNLLDPLRGCQRRRDEGADRRGHLVEAVGP